MLFSLLLCLFSFLFIGESRVLKFPTFVGVSVGLGSRPMSLQREAAWLGGSRLDPVGQRLEYHLEEMCGLVCKLETLRSLSHFSNMASLDKRRQPVILKPYIEE